jgi:hypothetical protein
MCLEDAYIHYIHLHTFLYIQTGYIVYVSNMHTYITYIHTFLYIQTGYIVCDSQEVQTALSVCVFRALRGMLGLLAEERARLKVRINAYIYIYVCVCV